MQVELHAVMPRFPIGTKFTPIGRYQVEHTIVNVHRSYDDGGNAVGIRYVTTHRGIGQVMESQHVETTVARGSPIFPDIGPARSPTLGL